ncbi:hypothetical protein [Chitinimonas sp.]|uniref:hypothetical protein n=1 Tax=Chitinimonas sp. TaxID=1934313 RepID=UPI0035B05C19
MFRIVPVSPVHIPGLCLAYRLGTERQRALAHSPSALTRTVLEEIAAGNHRYVAVAANQVVGWCGAWPGEQGWRLDIGVLPGAGAETAARQLLQTVVSALGDQLECAAALELADDAAQACGLSASALADLPGVRLGPSSTTIPNQQYAGAHAGPTHAQHGDAS